MDENRKVIRTATVILILLVAAVGVYYLFIADRGKPPVFTEPPPAGDNSVLEEKTPAGPGEDTAVTLSPDETDGPLRARASVISANPVFAKWLLTKDLLRRFVAAVDAVANGQSPRAQADFFRLSGPFAAVTRDGVTYLDPSSFGRYDVAADVLESLSPAACAKLYRDFQGPLRQAYKDLGYPQGDFHATLLRAIVEILRAPVVEKPIFLEKKIASYVMNDPYLEGLTAPQKHLLRMGPENVQLIQAKLRELALALGYADGQLPKPRTYLPTR